VSSSLGACYVDGRPEGDHKIGLDPAEVRALLQRRSQGLVWLDLDGDDEAAFLAAAEELRVHPLVVEDATHAHQRAKLNRYGDQAFVVLRPARWVAAEEEVEIGELHILAASNVVVTITRGVAPELAAVRKQLEERPERLAQGALAVLHGILDAVIDDYGPVITALEDAIDDVEDHVFAGQVGVARRVYRLMRQVIEVDRATEPLPAMLDVARSLTTDDDVEIRRHLDDMADHTVRVAERVEAFRTLLRHALELNSILLTEQSNDEARRLTEASLRQGEQVKRISSWAAILFAPSIVASIYGMNFVHMPELQWQAGYPLALGLMVGLGVVLYRAFKRRNWL
jgi:magnesium transporter